MSHVIGWIDANTGILTMRVPVWSAQREGETEEDFLTRLTNTRKAPNGTTFILNHEDCPHYPDGTQDRTFRSAWELDASYKPVVNMGKARGIHMDQIRQARNTELVKRDITFMRAIEAGDTSAQAVIATEKQTLRDIPQTFDLTTDTAEQLKAKWPSELPDRE
jgi:hypothetical protein